MLTFNNIRHFPECNRILLQAKQFICLRPHHALAEYISNYNITFPTKTLMPEGFTIMPSGCATLTISCDGQNLNMELDGPTSRPYVANDLALPEILITIEFKPAGLYALTSIPQNELADSTIPFADANPHLAAQISNLVETAETILGLAEGLDMLLLSNMRAAFHPQLALAFWNIKQLAGNAPIKMLSAETCYSERQLNRIFTQYVGVGTKAFSRLIRVNNAFKLLQKPASSVSLVSDFAGYHDLSHFVRDFKLVCDMTPQEFRNNMSDFYINPTKF